MPEWKNLQPREKLSIIKLENLKQSIKTRQIMTIKDRTVTLKQETQQLKVMAQKPTMNPPQIVKLILAMRMSKHLTMKTLNTVTRVEEDLKSMKTKKISLIIPKTLLNKK